MSNVNLNKPIEKGNKKIIIGILIGIAIVILIFILIGLTGTPVEIGPLKIGQRQKQSAPTIENPTQHLDSIVLKNELPKPYKDNKKSLQKTADRAQVSPASPQVPTNNSGVYAPDNNGIVMRDNFGVVDARKIYKGVPQRETSDPYVKNFLIGMEKNLPKNILILITANSEDNEAMNLGNKMSVWLQEHGFNRIRKDYRVIYFSGIPIGKLDGNRNNEDEFEISIQKNINQAADE
jgi:hypothetical protein